MIKADLEKQISTILQDLGVEEASVSLSYPPKGMGHYSSNAAMMYAKKLGQSPMQLAEQIVEKLKNETKDMNMQVVKPGFINFSLSSSELGSILPTILEQKNQYGTSSLLSGQKVMIEFTDPNPFKEFHIGHLYSNIVGESISRLYESQGATVWRACYQGDVGMHVAKALWGLQTLMNEQQKNIDEISELTLPEKSKLLGEAYALGASRFEENEEIKKEIAVLNKKIYTEDPEIMTLYVLGRAWSLDYFETIYTRLGTAFKKYYLESQVAKVGLEFVKEYLAKGIFKESNGAVIFPGEEYGLHTRVFINSLGLPTYEAKDLGLAPAKYNDFPYDTSIIITANEVNTYFQVILKVLSLIKPELAKKTTHLSHGLVKLPQGKMSSRSGNILTGEWLLNTAHTLATEKMDTPDDETAEKIAQAAVKYALLKSDIGRDIEFNFEESINFHGHSGPYLQYTFVRCQSIENKGGEKAISGAASVDYTQWTDEERMILWLLRKYQEILPVATNNHSPSLVCTYLFDLAQEFNGYYQKHTVLHENTEVRHVRLQLTAAVKQTLENGLYLLGIKTVSSM